MKKHHVLVYDDISNEFTGIAQTFTTLVSGVNTTGITTGSTFLTMNGIFQRPTTAENPLNNYDFIEETELLKEFQRNDSFLRPPMVRVL